MTEHIPSKAVCPTCGQRARKQRAFLYMQHETQFYGPCRDSWHDVPRPQPEAEVNK